MKTKYLLPEIKFTFLKLKKSSFKIKIVFDCFVTVRAIKFRNPFFWDVSFFGA